MALSHLFRMLALAFSYPDTSMIDKVRQDIRASLLALTEGQLPRRLRTSLQNAAQCWRRCDVEELRDAYSRLFLGAALVPLREGGYGDGMRFAGQPVDLADLNGFYLAFGFGPPTTAANPPDHLGVELEFVSLLYLKIAYALQQQQVQQARITRAALARFLEDHLGRWVKAFASSLSDASGHPAYESMAQILARATAAECERLGVRPRSAEAGTPIDPVGLDTLTCPLADKAGAEADASLGSRVSAGSTSGRAQQLDSRETRT